MNDDNFRLKFLRAEQFRPHQAAERMIRNLDLLSRYMGPQGLKRRITMGDLEENSLTILKLGSIQLLPSRDRSGRRIVIRIGPFGLDFIKHEKAVSILLHSPLKTLLFRSEIHSVVSYLLSFLRTTSRTIR